VKIIFDKKLFKRHAPKNIQKILSHHVDLIDGREVSFEGEEGFGTVEYEDEGQNYELYPVYPDWCREEIIKEKEPIASKQNRFQEISLK
jgi:hypothetical protein